MRRKVASSRNRLSLSFSLWSYLRKGLTTLVPYIYACVCMYRIYIILFIYIYISIYNRLYISSLYQVNNYDRPNDLESHIYSLCLCLSVSHALTHSFVPCFATFPFSPLLSSLLARSSGEASKVYKPTNDSLPRPLILRPRSTVVPRKSKSNKRNRKELRAILVLLPPFFFVLGSLITRRATRGRYPLR